MNWLVDDRLIDSSTTPRAPACRSISSCAASAACGRAFPVCPKRSGSSRIVGRFLEHSRICVFGNGHKLPSAGRQGVHQLGRLDGAQHGLARGNLVPIHNPTVHAQVLDQIMVVNLQDTLQSSEFGRTAAGCA